MNFHLNTQCPVNFLHACLTIRCLVQRSAGKLAWKITVLKIFWDEYCRFDRTGEEGLSWKLMFYISQSYRPLYDFIRTIKSLEILHEISSKTIFWMLVLIQPQLPHKVFKNWAICRERRETCLSWLGPCALIHCWEAILLLEIRFVRYWENSYWVHLGATQ